MASRKRSIQTLRSLAAALLAFAAAFCSAGLVHRDVVLEGEIVEVEEAVSRSRLESYAVKKHRLTSLCWSASEEASHRSLPSKDRTFSSFSEHSLRLGIGGPLRI